MLEKIAEYANQRRKNNKRFDEVLKALASHYNFSSGKYHFDRSYVKQFYDSIRNLEFYRENPFFWEQFALACMDIKDYITARQCVDNAYSEAKKKVGFVPFQVCTIDAELIIAEETNTLLIKTNLNNKDGERTCEAIRKAKDKLIRHYDHIENNKEYVFAITDKITVLYNTIRMNFTDRERNIYIQDMNELKAKINDYILNEEGQYDRNIKVIKNHVEASIEDAKSFLRK